MFLPLSSSLLILSFFPSTFSSPTLAPTRTQTTITKPSLLKGNYVPYSKLSDCPKLARKPRPTSAKDVRPDDFSVIMALGDSITAGLLARGGREDSSSSNMGSYSNRDQTLFLSTLVIEEYRGLSYAIGGDQGALTIPNLISHFSQTRGNITGASKGHHPPLTCLDSGIFNRPALPHSTDEDRMNSLGEGGLCLPHTKKDGLNAAISGSTSGSLLSQVRDHIIPTVQKLGIKDVEWKYVNVGIGANDVCAFCLTPDMTSPPGEKVSFTGSPEEFAGNIKIAIDELRAAIPNVIVNIVGVLRVSDIYKLTLKDPYCQSPLHLPIPHLALECSCGLLPGPAGDFTRKKMDELGDLYDEAVMKIIKEWEEEDDDLTFGAIWQPGTVVDLENYPITALSSIDCFHPSHLSHERVAAGFWNRLSENLEERYIPIQWEEEPLIRCLEEDDRIQVGMISQYHLDQRANQQL